MKCLAATQGPEVRVNAVLPGLLLTEWVSKDSQDDMQRYSTEIRKGSEFHSRKSPRCQRQIFAQEGSLSTYSLRGDAH